ncbi:hypothetical protein Pedsa_1284 [Pseudopedobacter saltans DSM 12145]|uniref:Uncharacterized protein n=1 Tax=Pseudopedobacter saltans (strain ATCC 51119 / DSM 12145 / JCM 21818 / CCUG 39354 / LMG 10337 / NBRC 100064 / NCIMB 13643) TaxID=762903 RepID=F0SDV5_PSESL|nr:hypothetical protein [Pseudopedobacter saltans]ADY51851.1 hypothetical protein Pedsa_1284 [Pseudopedobacter saltans DSM 12145]
MIEILHLLQELPVIKSEMQQIAELLKKMMELKAKENQLNALDKDHVVDATRVKKLLGISDSTLLRYKQKGILVPRALGGKFYLLSDIYAVEQKFDKDL